jgi:polyisoprenoid-binding protein YceI
MTADKLDQVQTRAGGGTGTSPAAQAAPQAGRYEIDTSCSVVAFRTRHLFGLAPVRGNFMIRAGAVDVAESLGDSRIHAEIDAASFRTGNPQRDASVRSARLLDVGRQPVITFVSERTDGSPLAGTLTVRDAAYPISLLIEQSAVEPGSFTARATTRIDRTQFGVTAYRGLAGRYLDITVEVRCIRK